MLFLHDNYEGEGFINRVFIEKKLRKIMATCKTYPLIKSSSTSFFLTGPFKYELCNDFSH